MKIAAAILAVAALGFGAAPAFAQKAAARDEPIDAGLVRELIADLPDDNEKLIGNIEITELLEEEEETFVFNIKPGKTYWIYGACDLECDDLDLKAHDENRNELDSDDEEDDAPILIFKSDKSRELRVTLFMASCDETSCHAGVGVYEQP